jgi:hypothetical protein
MNRKTMLFSLVMLCAMSMIGVASVSAQEETLVANIPFGFNVGDKALPAGKYEVQSLSPNTTLIRNLETSEAALAITRATEPQKSRTNACLVFHRYGRHSFLSQIMTQEAEQALSKSKLERRTAAGEDESAANTAAPQAIYVAAVLE